jgi:hypothetical protein
MSMPDRTRSRVQDESRLARDVNVRVAREGRPAGNSRQGPTFRLSSHARD